MILLLNLPDNVNVWEKDAGQIKRWIKESATQDNLDRSMLEWKDLLGAVVTSPALIPEPEDEDILRTVTAPIVHQWNGELVNCTHGIGGKFIMSKQEFSLDFPGLVGRCGYENCSDVQGEGNVCLSFAPMNGVNMLVCYKYNTTQLVAVYSLIDCSFIIINIFYIHRMHCSFCIL